MKKIVVVLAMLLLTGCAEWNTNKALYVASTGALVADWGQTRYIASHPRNFHENNPILGKHPTVNKVDRYFTGWVLGNTLMYFVLPEKWQPYWFGGMLGIETYCIGNNTYSGIKFDWGL